MVGADAGAYASEQQEGARSAERRAQSAAAARAALFLATTRARCELIRRPPPLPAPERAGAAFLRALSDL